MDPNAVFPVEIRMNAIAPESITWTSVYFSYPVDKIDVSFVRPGTAFPVNIGNTYGNGTFAMTRQNVSGVTGDVLVATVGFKPKMVNTTASLQFVDGITALQQDGTESLDMEWTKANIANYNIKDGQITYSASKSQGGITELPTAGFWDNTLIWMGFGLGSVGLAGVGLYKARSSRQIV